MQHILDPADLWLGRPGRSLSSGDRKPVTFTDAVTVLRDSAPVSIAVLDNDFDREGPLTLISAFAALGTAVAEADGTVSYSPIPGFVGFDTVVYEVADSLDQRATEQANIEVAVPELGVEIAPNSTFVVIAEPVDIDIALTQPVDLAGSYTADLGELAGGPVNLLPPRVVGTVAEGETLTAKPGLWIHDEASETPARAWQWRRDGADIPGATTANYVLAAADGGTSVVAAERLIDGAGTRLAVSGPVVLGSAGFTPAADTQKIAWWDADVPASLTLSGNDVTSWADLVSGQVLAPQSGTLSPVSGTRSLNGRNAIEFVTACLQGSLALPASGDVAFHLALAIDDVGSEYGAILAVDAVNDFQLDAAAADQFNGRLLVAGIGTTTALTGGLFSSALILSAVFDRSSTATAEVFVANVSRAAMAYTAPLDPNVALHLMANRARNATIDGAVGELIVTADISSRDDYHGYLSEKWGAVQ